MREDVEAAIARAAASRFRARGPRLRRDSAPPVTAGARRPSSAAPACGSSQARPRDEAEPLSRMRLAIGERMIDSLRIAPHVWTSVEVDLQASRGGPAPP